MQNKHFKAVMFIAPAFFIASLLAFLSGCGGGGGGGGTSVTAEGGYIYDSEWKTFGTDPEILKFPSCVAVDASFAYICDYDNNRILKVRKDGIFTGTAFNPDSDPADTVFPGPSNISFDTSGNLYIANANEGAVVAFNPSGIKQAISFAADKMISPKDAAIASAKLFVADRDLDAVSILDQTNGNFLSSSGKVTVSAGETIEFNSPNAIASDASNIYVSNTYNHQILKLDLSLNYVAKWGSQGSGEGQLSQPSGIFVSAAADGDVFVADTGNHRILRFSKTGELRGAFGRLGSGPGQFNGPMDVFADSSTGYVYVADSSNNRIQVFRKQ